MAPLSSQRLVRDFEKQKTHRPNGRSQATRNAYDVGLKDHEAIADFDYHSFARARVSFISGASFPLFARFASDLVPTRVSEKTLGPTTRILCKGDVRARSLEFRAVSTAGDSPKRR